MVLTRSMAARRTLLALPHDIVVEIAGHIAASSPQPMEDICSLRATCQATHAACKEGAVGRRVALEREHTMRWFEHDRYLALVRNLAGAGNPEACFVLGLTLVFTQGRTGLGTDRLKRAAVAGHKAAAYVLGVLCYTNGETRDDAKRYIRQIEAETAPDGGGVHGHGCKAAMKTNRECIRWRDQAVHAIREVTWRMDREMVPVPVAPPEDEDDGQHCEGSGCGVPDGWNSGCAVFCSEGCRIRHEYFQFFSRVSLPAR
ncbi:hypothetical protein BS78_03G068300 [Paspalum vaginatum]|nr:hypothetical protein BS78_03G068300 [Paspalum vaginatum]